MPIYAYRCAACGHAQDSLQKLSDPLLTICPVCGEPALQKQVTAAGFQLKGSGWYVTDFRGDGQGRKKPAEGEGAEKTATDGADAPKPDAAATGDKPAAAPAAGAAAAAPAGASSSPATSPAPASSPAAPSAGSSDK